MKMKTTLYIDAFNLYYGALKGTPYKWLNPLKLAQLILGEAHEVGVIKYFTARVVSRPDNPGQLTRQLFYLRALRTLPGMEIIFGHYLTHKVKMPLANPQLGTPRFAEVIKTEEKGSDVNLASHLLVDAFDNAYDCAVLISGDSDLAMPVEIVKSRFGKVVGVLNPQHKKCQRLSQTAVFYKHMRPSALEASQFQDVIHDSHGVFNKPNEW